MYFKADTLFKELTTVLQANPEARVDIATYGFYLDISKNKRTKEYSDWSEVFGASAARTFIEEVTKTQHRLIVGLFPLRECTPGCEHCNKMYDEGMERNLKTQAKLALNIRYHKDSHLKYYRIGNRIWVGGINLSSSDWTDVAVEVLDRDEKLQLIEIFKNHWQTATETIGAIKSEENEANLYE